jgi:stage II sporulation protein P
VIIDLHRDSIQTDDGTNYKTVVQTDGQKMAQAMLVIGTNDSGLDHPNWKQNLAFAMQLQKRANEAYPGLMRPINLRRERFNGHATSGAVLLEVGSAANTLGEAIETARRMAAVMGDCVLGR